MLRGNEASCPKKFWSWWLKGKHSSLLYAQGFPVTQCCPILPICTLPIPQGAPVGAGRESFMQVAAALGDSASRNKPKVSPLSVMAEWRVAPRSHWHESVLAPHCLLLLFLTHILNFCELCED